MIYYSTWYDTLWIVIRSICVSVVSNSETLTTSKIFKPRFSQTEQQPAVRVSA